MSEERSSRTVIEVRPIRSDDEWRAVKAIRTTVFVDEQGCPPELEWDEHEGTARHFIGLLDGEPIAAARWRTYVHDEQVVAKLERFAVLREYRGRGFGRTLVEEVMVDARRAGFDTMRLHAQKHLEGFYRSFGFETVGPEFEEAGIPHVPMVRMR